MSSDFDDGAREQALKKPVFDPYSMPIAYLKEHPGPINDGDRSQPLGFIAGSPPIQDTENLEKDRAAIRRMMYEEVGMIDPEDLAAWRTAMRAEQRPAEPKRPDPKAPKRPKSAFEKPQQWNDPRSDR